MAAGEGTRARPIVISSDGTGASYVIGSATESVLVKVTGSGTPDSPYRVSMDRLPGAGRPIMATFTAPGVYVWAKPTFGTMALCSILGGGGGGAGGTDSGPGVIVNPGVPAYSDARVGLGGKGADEVRWQSLLADLDATTQVVVGGGGTGGPATGYPGTPGAPGLASSFGRITALGGQGGVTVWQGNYFDADVRTPAYLAEGGAGGLYRPGFTDGLVGGIAGNGAGAYGGTPGISGGSAAGAGQAPAGAVLSAVRGGGGGGGWSPGAGNVSGSAGGAGGPGAGGGGGGVGGVSGGPGGRGGDGVVRIVIQ